MTMEEPTLPLGDEPLGGESGANDSLSRRLATVQAQQAELIRLQHATVERLDELTDQLQQSSRRIDAIFDRRQAMEFPDGPSF